MFHDLDVQVAPANKKNAIDCLSRLGYDVVAFNTVLAGHKKFPENVTRPPAVDDADPPSQQPSTYIHCNPNKRAKRLTVLERITLVIDDPSHLALLGAKQLNQFDLVAVQPTSEKLLQQCFQFDFDIISLSLEARAAFQVKRPHFNLAAEKGMMFEISYAPALRDVVTRRNVIANIGAVIRTTKGQQIVLSSGARSIMELRGPHDVMNLGIIFDIPDEHARGAVTTAAALCVQHGEIRSRVHKGIVRSDQPPDQV